MLTAEQLRALLDYDPETGVFRWCVVQRNSVHIGAVAGTLDSQGYIRISVYGRKYAAHRLAILYTDGAWPPMEVDHINGRRSDNRRSNLRESTRAGNCRNARLRRDSTSGIKGVTRHSGGKRWQVHVRVNGKYMYLGLYEDLELAELVAEEARNKYHGAFANHGG